MILLCSQIADERNSQFMYIYILELDKYANTYINKKYIYIHLYIYIYISVMCIYLHKSVPQNKKIYMYIYINARLGKTFCFASLRIGNALVVSTKQAGLKAQCLHYPTG